MNRETDCRRHGIRQWLQARFTPGRPKPDRPKRNSRTPRFETLEERRSLSIGSHPTPSDYTDLSVAEGTSEIHGRKWHDLNADGIHDPGEPGLDGWTIELVDPADGSVIATTVTTGVDLNEDGSIDPETEAGHYSFAGLAPGRYEVRAVEPDGWTQTSPLTIPTSRLGFVQVLRDDVDGVDGLDGVDSVTISPDGSHVYATGYSDDAVVVFSRDWATGGLGFVQMFRDGQDGVEGLDGAGSVTLSPDGKHLYVAGTEDRAIVVFSRDVATGELTLVQTLRPGDGDEYGLWGMNGVTISPDGEHIYVTSSKYFSSGFSRYWRSELAVFSRDEATGELGFVQAIFNGQNGVEGLDGASSLTLTPDGHHAYTLSVIDDGMAVFSRNAATGLLEFVRVFRPGGDTIGGVRNPSSTSSPDGSYLYVTDSEDDAVAVLSRPHVAGPHQLLLAPREILTGRDFGNYQPASLSGQAFEDLNDNGTRDAGEPGLDGWTIELVDPATAEVIDTRVTAAVDLDENGVIDLVTEAGLYSFDGLAPGDYEVRDVLEAGFVRTYPSQAPHSVTLLSGDATAVVDFGQFHAVPLTPLGEVDLTTLDGITPDVSGQWYSLTTTHNALLTVALAAGDTDGVELSLTDELPVNDQSVAPLAVSTLVRGTPRFDHHVGKGKTLYLHVAGNGSPIDLTVANLVRQTDGDVRVFGTDGDDHFEMVAEHRNLGINGIWYDFDASQTATVTFGGSQGNNTAMIHGTPGVESAELWSDRAEISGEGYSVVLANVTATTVDGLGGDDKATLHDSPDDDHFSAWPGGALMRSDVIAHRVDHFENVVARATAGGIDVAKFFDSPGNDRYVGTATYNSLSGEGFHNEVWFFEASHAYATGGGVDEARFYDSTGDDSYVTTPTYAALFNGDYRDGDMAHGFYNRAKYFAEVHATAGEGDDDRAYLHDSVMKHDELVGTEDRLRMITAAMDVLFEASGFDYMKACATNNGDMKTLPESDLLRFDLELEGPWKDSN